MKLVDLFEDSGFNAEKEKTALINKLRTIKADIKELKSKAANMSQSGFDQKYKTQLDRLNAAKKEAERELGEIPTREQHAQKAHEAEKQRAEKKAAETDDEKKERFGKAVGQGLNQTNKLRKEEGGHEGVADKVYNYVKNATKDGVEKITAEDIAHHFNTTARTVNRWLERKEFTKVARLMGRR